MLFSDNNAMKNENNLFLKLLLCHQSNLTIRRSVAEKRNRQFRLESPASTGSDQQDQRP